MINVGTKNYKWYFNNTYFGVFCFGFHSKVLEHRFLKDTHTHTHTHTHQERGYKITI